MIIWLNMYELCPCNVVWRRKNFIQAIIESFFLSPVSQGSQAVSSWQAFKMA